MSSFIVFCTFLVLLQFFRRTRNKAFSVPRNTFLGCVSAKPYQNVWARSYGYFYGRLWKRGGSKRWPTLGTGFGPRRSWFFYRCLFFNILPLQLSKSKWIGDRTIGKALRFVRRTYPFFLFSSVSIDWNYSRHKEALLCYYNSRIFFQKPSPRAARHHQSRPLIGRACSTLQTGLGSWSQLLKKALTVISPPANSRRSCALTYRTSSR